MRAHVWAVQSLTQLSPHGEITQQASDHYLERDHLKMLLVHHDRPQICHSSPKLLTNTHQLWAMRRQEGHGGCGMSLSMTLPYMGPISQEVFSLSSLCGGCSLRVWIYLYGRCCVTISISASFYNLPVVHSDDNSVYQSPLTAVLRWSWLMNKTCLCIDTEG